jgi:malate dehydrogenase
VAVTGAAGQIGYALLPLSANGTMFGPSTPVELRLLEIAPALPALAGVAMELADGAYTLLAKTVCTADATEAFAGVNIVILVGAFPRRAGMERSDLLRKNAAIFKAQGRAIGAGAAKGVKIVVVGNPANTNATILAHYAPSVPRTDISALTRLDHNRVVGMVAATMSVPADKVAGVCIWGNHSSTQYPDVTRATAGTAGGVAVVKALGGQEGLAAVFRSAARRSSPRAARAAL